MVEFPTLPPCFRGHVSNFAVPRVGRTRRLHGEVAKLEARRLRRQGGRGGDSTVYVALRPLPLLEEVILALAAAVREALLAAVGTGATSLAAPELDVGVERTALLPTLPLEIGVKPLNLQAPALLIGEVGTSARQRPHRVKTLAWMVGFPKLAVTGDLPKHALLDALHLRKRPRPVLRRERRLRVPRRLAGIHLYAYENPWRNHTSSVVMFAHPRGKVNKITTLEV